MLVCTMFFYVLFTKEKKKKKKPCDYWLISAYPDRDTV